MSIERMQNRSDVYLAYSDERLHQVFALLSLYYATNDSGDGWSSVPSWQTLYDECTWEGIVCDNVDRVVEINLTGFGLNGALPAELALLEFAHTLRLDDNPGLFGAIPRFLAGMNLVELTITGCGYVGEMPEEICQLKVNRSLVLLEVDCLDKIACDRFCCENCG